MDRTDINKCPKCGSRNLMYTLGKDGVAVMCQKCGKTGPRATTSWSADAAWNKMKSEKNA